MHSNQSAFAQTVTLASINGGLQSGNITAGQTQRPVYGFSVQVSGGSVTFGQFNLTCSHTTQDYMANGTLYRRTSNTYSSSSPGTPVGNVIFNGNNITMSGLTETITNATNYYFLVIDAVNTTNGYSVQIINTYGANLATSTSGTNYPLNDYSARSYDFVPSSPYVLTLANRTTELSSNSVAITPGTTNTRFFEFTVKNNSSSAVTISGFNINSNVTLSSYLNNFRLYASSSTTFPGSATATGSASGTYVGFSGLGETIAAGATKYYWLVADCPNGSSTGDVQFNFKAGQSTNAVTTSTPSSGTYNTFTAHGNTYGFAYTTVNVSSQQNGISSGTITAGQTDVVLFGFGVSSTANISLSQFNINSTGPASSYFGNARLYRASTNNYGTASKTLVGTTTFNGTYANVVFNTAEPITSTATYYFLVADNTGANASNPTISFNFASGQGTGAVVQSVPGASTYNTFNVTGNSFTIPSPTIVYANNTTGYTAQTTVVAGQAAVISGFDVKPIGDISITSPYINFAVSGGNPSGLFSNLQLWVSTTGSYATATQVTGISTGNAGAGIRISLPSTLALTSGTTYSYYVVGTVTSSSALPTTRTIGSLGIESNNSNNDFPTSALSQPSINFVTGSITIEGNNSASSGITQGALSYGQTNIVLFSYKLTAMGAFTISTMCVPSTTAMGSYFTNGKVFRSSTPYFSDATQIAGAAVAFNSGSSANLSNLNQTFTASSNTSYYYFIVGDLTASTDVTATTVTYNFTSGQATAAINAGNGNGLSFNTFTTTDGKTFTIVNTIKWLGGTSTNFNTASNFRDLKGNNVSVPTGTTVVEIGVETFTNAPTISGSASFGGFTFGAVKTPIVTLAANATLTVANGINAINGVTATITGPSTATLNISSGAQSAVSAGSTLVLTGGMTANNAGTLTVNPTSVLNVTGGSTLANTGTLTLSSGPNGSATIGALANSAGTVTGTITGTVKVERYITGGTITYRGYRLLSSPVQSGSSGNYSLSYLKGGGSFLTGSGGSNSGWDTTGNATLYFYRPDKMPSATFANGNYRPVIKINKTPNAYLVGTADGDFNLGVGNGYLMFYRGNNSTVTTTVPNSLVITASGTLNQGAIRVKPWFTGLSDLDYTSVAGNSDVRGFNLVGNPYASTIDWETKGTSSTNGIYATNIADIIYIVDPVTQGYSTYIKGGGSTLNGSRYIPTGQGFFVLANNTGAQLTFRENAKVNTQVTGNSLLLNTLENAQIDRHIRVQLYKDVAVYDDVFIGFKQNASSDYVYNEDGPYLKGNGKINLASLTADKQAMAINYMPLAAKRQAIALRFTVNAYGAYKLNTTEIKDVPGMFNVWLYDSLTKDSLDIRKNKQYEFNVTTDTATFSANRFKILLTPDPDKVARILNFIAEKATDKVNIKWTVENEFDYTFYAIERSIDAGKTFQVLDTLTSAGLGTYQYVDVSPVEGLNQYRLKQVDVLGNVTYSDISNVLFSPKVSNSLANNLINVYPNPVIKTLNLAITPVKQAATSYKITITNTSGLVVQSASTADVNWQADLSTLLPGTYFVQVINTKDNTVTGKSTFIKL